jgi:hypothetical protein
MGNNDVGTVEFIPCKNINGLYFILPDVMDFHEQFIAKYIDISLFQYRFKLAKEFNGMFDFSNSNFYFNKEEDCQHAIDWIYSVKVMIKLSECNETISEYSSMKYEPDLGDIL